MRAAWKYWNITSFPFYYLSSTFYNLETGTTKICCYQTPGSCGFDFIFHQRSIGNDWRVWAEDKEPGGIQFSYRLLSWCEKFSMTQEELDLWVCARLMRVILPTISSKTKKINKIFGKYIKSCTWTKPQARLHRGHQLHVPCITSSSEGHSADPFIWVPSLRDIFLPSQVVWLEVGMLTAFTVWSTGWHAT